jgi:hypothetical protein
MTNINVTNNGPTQNQFGDNNTQTQNVGGQLFDPSLLDGLQKAFNDAAADETDITTKAEACFGETVDPDAVFESLKAAAAPDTPPEQVEQATSGWRDLIAKYSPKVQKAVIAFAQTALEKYASQNPLIAGVISALKTLES